MTAGKLVSRRKPGKQEIWCGGIRVYTSASNNMLQATMYLTDADCDGMVTVENEAYGIVLEHSQRFVSTSAALDVSVNTNAKAVESIAQVADGSKEIYLNFHGLVLSLPQCQVMNSITDIEMFRLPKYSCHVITVDFIFALLYPFKRSDPMV